MNDLHRSEPLIITADVPQDGPAAPVGYLVTTDDRDPYDPGTTTVKHIWRADDLPGPDAFPVWMWDIEAECWYYLASQPERESIYLARYLFTNVDAAREVGQLNWRDLNRNRVTASRPDGAPNAAERRARRAELLHDMDDTEGSITKYGARSLGAYPLLVATFTDWYGWPESRADDAAWALWAGYSDGAWHPDRNEGGSV